MASKRYGVKPSEWWKHLRWTKRDNNKRVRVHRMAEADDALMECGICGEIDLPVTGGECNTCHTLQLFRCAP